MAHSDDNFSHGPLSNKMKCLTMYFKIGSKKKESEFFLIYP